MSGRPEMDKSIVERLSSLEKLVFPQEPVRSSLSVKERIDSLLASAPLSDSTIEKSKRLISQNNGGWFWNPPQIKWLGDLGKGAKSLGKKTKDATANLATSPTFWTLLLGATAVTALVLMSRDNSGTLPAYIANENACSGNAMCNRCTNCRYCHYCNSGLGGACGVRIRILQFSN
ncbi:MAG: hypothetical protein K2X27_21150 [Candidatus Obscuribacterales bacterium]|nr:hypothetical protein [Candidatus Obscuribacterales bacterium]